MNSYGVLFRFGGGRQLEGRDISNPRSRPGAWKAKVKKNLFQSICI